MIEGHLLNKVEKDKVFQMGWKVVILVLEADFVFLPMVGGAEPQHFLVLIVVFLGEKMELSDE